MEHKVGYRTTVVAAVPVREVVSGDIYDDSVRQLEDAKAKLEYAQGTVNVLRRRSVEDAKVIAGLRRGLEATEHSLKFVRGHLAMPGRLNTEDAATVVDLREKLRGAELAADGEREKDVSAEDSATFFESERVRLLGALKRVRTLAGMYKGYDAGGITSRDGAWGNEAGRRGKELAQVYAVADEALS